MPNSPIAALPGPPKNGVKPEIDVFFDTLNQALDTVVAPTFASTSARDSAYSSVIAAGKVGMRCYISNRAGYCSYIHTNSSGKAWVWEPQHNVLLDGHRPSPADAAGTAPVDILLMPAVALPPGNRKVSVRASSVVEALTGACTPRAYVDGPGIASYETYMQTSLPALSVQGTVSREWTVVTSGTVAWNLRGINAGAGANVRFVGSILQVVDLGPA